MSEPIEDDGKFFYGSYDPEDRVTKEELAEKMKE